MSEHIEKSTLIAFMLNQERLGEEDDRHLSHCKECHGAMVEATLAHLANEPIETKSSS